MRAFRSKRKKYISMADRVKKLTTLFDYVAYLGFKLTGIGERRTCSSVGAWRPAAPLCEETLCKEGPK